MKKYIIMKKILFFVLILAGLIAFGRSGNATLPVAKDQVFFIENQGQWPSQVQYLVKTSGVNVWITNRELIYDYYRIIPSVNGNNLTNSRKSNHLKGTVKGHVVAMTFGCNVPAEKIQAMDQQTSYYNYFLGNDPSHWATGVPLYKTVILKEVYPGIDVELYTDNGNLRYDFLLKPGSDPRQIRLSFKGADGVDVENGNLMINTSVGEKIQGDIHAFQGNDKIDCRIIKIAGNVAGFKLGRYNETRPLRIDPLVYSTYLGGNSDDVAIDVALDGNDAMYITGSTWSTDFPTTDGAYQRDLKGADDVFVSGFSADGQNLLFSTYLGGSYSDEATSLAYNDGKIYVTGIAYSEDFPITDGAFQDANHLGGDVFVTSLSSNGQSLGFSTYVGGFGFDCPTKLEAGDNIFVGGYTNSDDFPVTGDAYDNTFGGGNPLHDGFVFKMNTSGGMLYSSYFGGSGDDQIYGICIDPTAPEVYYLTGQTTSSNFPVTDNALDNQLGDGTGGNEDAFVAEFTGNQLNYSTYLGGTSTDYATDVAVNANHFIMVSGSTYSDDFPVTPDAFSSQRQGTYEDAFVTQLKPGGNSGSDDLKYSSYFGGSFEEEVGAVLLKGEDKLYITGYTSSQNFPVTPGAVSQEAIGNMDVFLTRFNFSDNSLDYSTYLGGSFDDIGSGLAEKSNGQVVISGSTMSFNFPVTNNAYDTTYHSENSSDAFLSVIGVVPTGIVENKLRNPLHINQNQPNPFRTKTTIAYRLEAQGDVVLKVYDCTGNEVLQRYLPSQTRGEHQVDLNMAGFSPGIYFYSIKSEQWAESRKMVVR